jgi:hypothetical protein
MKLIKILLICFSFALVSFNQTAFSASFAETKIPEETVHPWPEIVDYARANFPQEGILTAKSDGFVYLKVDDEYIRTLFPMLGLKEEGYTEPPYFRTSDSPGAHISVIYADENVLPKEVGQSFPIELKEIVIVQPSKATAYAVLQIESPELEQLRQKYGLTPKLHGHEYHISLAKKILRSAN